MDFGVVVAAYQCGKACACMLDIIGKENCIHADDRWGKGNIIISYKMANHLMPSVWPHDYDNSKFVLIVIITEMSI